MCVCDCVIMYIYIYIHSICIQISHVDLSSYSSLQIDIIDVCPSRGLNYLSRIDLDYIHYLPGIYIYHISKYYMYIYISTYLIYTYYHSIIHHISTSQYLSCHRIPRSPGPVGTPPWRWNSKASRHRVAAWGRRRSPRNLASFCFPTWSNGLMLWRYVMIYVMIYIYMLYKTILCTYMGMKKI